MGEGGLRSCHNLFGPLFLDFVDLPLSGVVNKARETDDVNKERQRSQKTPLRDPTCAGRLLNVLLWSGAGGGH